MRRVDPPPLWWTSEDLHYISDSLYFGSQKLEDIASRGTPVYVLRPARVSQNLQRLLNAAPDFSIFYAIKANRHPLIIHRLKQTGISGIDVCSPEESKLALSAGFSPNQISFTGTSVSNADLDFLTSEPEIHINVDSLSGLRRLLSHSSPAGKKGRKEIGIRINPELGLGYHQEERLTYSGTDQMSKFGILQEQIEEALKIARSYGVAITTLHWHVGCGWLNEQQEQFQKVVQKGLEFAVCFPDLQRINLGGGLGVPLVQEDQPLDLVAWSQVIHSLVQNRWQIMIEPGAYLVQNSSLLLVEVCTVEPKRGQYYIGINSGFNLLIEPVFYGMPSEAVPLRLNEANASKYPCVFAGNINEAHDVLPQRLTIPLPREGDFFALLNSGAYATSMASNHCLRGCSREIIVD